MALWMTLRLAKFLGVIAFAMGIALALGNGPARARQRAAYWIATPGFVVTWIAGWGMAKMYAISLGAPWISVSMVASLIALHEAVRAVEPGRERSPWRVALTIIALVVAVASMVIRYG